MGKKKELIRPLIYKEKVAPTYVLMFEGGKKNAQELHDFFVKSELPTSYLWYDDARRPEEFTVWRRNGRDGRDEAITVPAGHGLIFTMSDGQVEQHSISGITRARLEEHFEFISD